MGVRRRGRACRARSRAARRTRGRPRGTCPRCARAFCPTSVSAKTRATTRGIAAVERSVRDAGRKRSQRHGANQCGELRTSDVPTDGTPEVLAPADTRPSRQGRVGVGGKMRSGQTVRQIGPLDGSRRCQRACCHALPMPQLPDATASRPLERSRTAQCGRRAAAGARRRLSLAGAAPARVVDRRARLPSPLGPPGLPPVPAIVGAALVPRVQYPSRQSAHHAAAIRTSCSGSVGSGDAQLSINGTQRAAWRPTARSSRGCRTRRHRDARYDLMVDARRPIRCGRPCACAIRRASPSPPTGRAAGGQQFAVADARRARRAATSGCG